MAVGDPGGTLLTSSCLSSLIYGQVMLARHPQPIAEKVKVGRGRTIMAQEGNSSDIPCFRVPF